MQSASSCPVQVEAVRPLSLSAAHRRLSAFVRRQEAMQPRLDEAAGSEHNAQQLQLILRPALSADTVAQLQHCRDALAQQLGS